MPLIQNSQFIPTNLDAKLLLAKNPKYSVWVNASAGTGKTKLLTDRVISLLIHGVECEKILCLTFTKAARGEMISRINSTLHNWSLLNEEILSLKLENIYGQKFSKAEVLRAKSLYKEITKTSSRLKIYTIHGFCQHLLQKFPIESLLKPSFKVLSESDSLKILEELFHEREFLDIIPLELLQWSSIFSLSEMIISAALKFDENADYHIEEAKILYEIIGSSINENEEFIIADLKAKLTHTALNSLPDYLYVQLQNFLSNSEIYNDIKYLFLTQNLDPRKKIISKKDIKDENTEDIILQIQDLFINAERRRISNLIAQKTTMLEKASKELARIYQNYKREKNLLDYSDLISYSKFLLSMSETREWVKYKLDGGIDHILVDESQDTSSHQWDIIHALISDFYTGDSAATKAKTIFVVGDIKQSIYSFQGARPDLFLPTKELLQFRSLEAKKHFLDIELNKTYRLPKAIYDFVANVFLNSAYIEKLPALECARAEEFSAIEILPLTKKLRSQEYFWPVPEDFEDIEITEKNHAENIANYVTNLLDSYIYLCSKKRRIKAGDIIILVQRRTKLLNYLFEQLVEKQIEVAGLDRISFVENLPVQDLIGIIKYLVIPEDTLNFASILKSPYFNLTDQDILNFSATNFSDLFLNEHHPEIFSKLQIIKQQAVNLSINDFLEWLITTNDIFDLYKNAGKFEFIDGIKSFLLELKQLQHAGKIVNYVGIIDYFSEQNTTLKRELTSSNSVRIMTIHAAKGLEAPVIILADSNDYLNTNSNMLEEMRMDTPALPKENTSNQKHINRTRFLWAKSTEKNEIVLQLKELRKEEDLREYHRLLYVALTRAQDRLVIAGIESTNVTSWYSLCKDAAVKYFSSSDDGKLYLSEGKFPDLIEDNSHNQNISNFSLPQILWNSSELNQNHTNHLKIQHAILVASQAQAVQGQIIHKFLEGYNGFENNVDGFIKDISSLYDGLNEEELKLLLCLIVKDEYLKYLFSLPHEKEAEICVVDNIKTKILRLDLVAFNGEEIIIVDYKTDKNKDNIASYKNQLYSYKNALSKIYPASNIKIQIYWIRLSDWEVIE